MDIASNIFMDESIKAVAEKYERLRLQRLAASKKWNNSHRERVNEYNKKYQKKIYAKKKNNEIQHYNGSEEYLKYQSFYRTTKHLRKLPFFNCEVL